MKKTFLADLTVKTFCKTITSMIITLTCLFSYSAIQAKEIAGKPFIRMVERFVDTIKESKVDYLERIYFSGENKEGLNNLILRTLQQFEGKPATAAVAVQYSFLSEIKQNAEAAEKSCDVEELLAAGIYGFDVDEALKNGIPKPSSKVTGQLSSIINSSQAISNSTRDASYSAWVLSNGRVSGYNSMYKLGTAANKVGAAGSLLSEGKQISNALKFLNKDKPCKSVPKKDMQIGEHVLPANIGEAQNKTPGSTIIVKNLKYNQISTISSAIEKISGVTAVSNDNFANNTATFTVTNTMKIKELVDNIVKAIDKLEVEGLTQDSATLSLK